MHIFTLIVVLLLTPQVVSGEHEALFLLLNGTLVRRPAEGGAAWSVSLGGPLLAGNVGANPVASGHPFTLEGAQLTWTHKETGVSRISLDELALRNPSVDVDQGVLAVSGVHMTPFAVDLRTGSPITDISSENAIVIARFDIDLSYRSTVREWDFVAARVFCISGRRFAEVCPGDTDFSGRLTGCLKALRRATGSEDVKAYITSSTDPLTTTVGFLRNGAVVGQVVLDTPEVESVFYLEEGVVYALDSHTTDGGLVCSEDESGCELIPSGEVEVGVSSLDSRRLRLSYVLEAVSPAIDGMSPEEIGRFVKWGRQYIQTGEQALPVEMPLALPISIATPVSPSEIRSLAAPPPPAPANLRLYAYVAVPLFLALTFWLGVDMRKSFQDGWEAGFGAGEQRRKATLPDSDDTRSNSSDHPPPEDSDEPELLSLLKRKGGSSSSSETSSSATTVLMSRAASFANSMLPSLEMITAGAGGGSGQPALFFQHYSVEKRVGSGVRGAVFCARQHVTGKLFGIKVVVLAKGGEQRAIDEARLHSTLDNTHVVRYFNCWVEELPLQQVMSMRMLPDVDSMIGSSLYGDETEDSQSVTSHNGHFPNTGGKLHFSTWSDEGSSPTSAGGGSFPVSSSPVQREPSYACSEASPESTIKGARGCLNRTLRLLFMQMEYYEAGTLRDYLIYRAEAFALPPVAGEPIDSAAYYRYRNLSILLDLAQGLSYLKERKIIHRDIKPSNIFVSNGGPVSKHIGGPDVGTTAFARMSKNELRRFFYVSCPPTFKIGDFGAAVDTVAHPAYTGKKSVWYQSAEAVPHDRNVTVNGATTCFGTPPYASPDQVRGELVGFGSDVFSLGVIGVELLHDPFTTDHERLVVLQAAVEGNLPESLREGCPEECELLSKMLSQREHKRPQLKAIVARLKVILASPKLAEAERAVREQESRLPVAERPVRIVTPLISNLHTPTTPAPEV